MRLRSWTSMSFSAMLPSSSAQFQALWLILSPLRRGLTAKPHHITSKLTMVNILAKIKPRLDCNFSIKGSMCYMCFMFSFPFQWSVRIIRRMSSERMYFWETLSSSSVTFQAKCRTLLPWRLGLTARLTPITSRLAMVNPDLDHDVGLV